MPRLTAQRVTLDFVALTPTHATFAQHRDDGAAEVILQLPLARWEEAEQRRHLVVDIELAD